MTLKKYDVAIIGAGTAGLTARKKVSQHTDNYIVIDDGILGTTCARVGCMPSKVLIQVANDFYRKNVFKAIGIGGGDKLTINHKQVMKHVRKLRDRFVKGVITDLDSWKSTHFVAKRATFVDQQTLDLGDEKIQANKIIIATGSRPVIPQSWQEFSSYFTDTNQIFELEDLPKKMAVIGLGVIGIELGQALHRLEVDVIGIARRRCIGGVTDPELAEYVSTKFSEEMNIDFTGVESLSVKNDQLVICTKEKEYTVDKALLSMGRRPNLDNLGLEKINVPFRPDGIPDFDPRTFQIKNTSIFVAGDANAEKTILHESADEGSVAGFNAVADKATPFKRRTPLGITFSSPNIATIGMNYKALQEQNIDFATGEVSFEGQGRSIVMLAEKGLLHVYGDKKTNKILGAELFAPSGEHLAHLLAWVIANDMTVQEVLSLPFYHPVVEEGLRTALRNLARKLTETRSPLELAVCEEHSTS